MPFAKSPLHNAYYVKSICKSAVCDTQKITVYIFSFDTIFLTVKKHGYTEIGISVSVKLINLSVAERYIISAWLYRLVCGADNLACIDKLLYAVSAPAGYSSDCKYRREQLVGEA